MEKRFGIISTNELGWGGSEMCWAAAAEKLVRRGANVSISVKDWGQPVKELERLGRAGCRIFLRPEPTLPGRIRRLVTRRPPQWSCVRPVASGADLLIVSQGGTHDGLWWSETVHSFDIPYVVIVQSASDQWWPTDDARDRLAPYYEGARAVYFVSEANRALVRQELVSPLERARVIRNPFNVRYDARPPWPEGPIDRLQLACVARLEMRQKAQDLLIEVLKLPHWQERNVHLTLVGSGLNADSLRKLIEMSGLKNVEVGGFAEDIEQVWARHHALILSSRFEGMPLSLVEAMLCGRPCIVTDVGGNRELVRDGVNGFLAKAPTVESLDEALNRAWENRQRLCEMGEQAAVDVRRWVSADPVEDLVRELMGLVEPQASGSPQDVATRREIARAAADGRG